MNSIKVSIFLNGYSLPIENKVQLRLFNDSPDQVAKEYMEQIAEEKGIKIENLSYKIQ